MNLTEILNNHHDDKFYKTYYQLYFWEHGTTEFWPNIEYNINTKIIKLNLIGEEKEYKYYIQEINCKFSMHLNNTDTFYPMELKWGGGYIPITNQFLFPGHEKKGFDCKKLRDIPFDSYKAAEEYVFSFKRKAVNNIKLNDKNYCSNDFPKYKIGEKVRIVQSEFKLLGAANYYINDEVIILDSFKEVVADFKNNKDKIIWKYRVKAANENESEFKRHVKFYFWPEDSLELIE